MKKTGPSFFLFAAALLLLTGCRDESPPVAVQAAAPPPPALPPAPIPQKPPVPAKPQGELAAVLPRPQEERWMQIPWRTNVMQARAESQRSGKPLFLWVMDGNPLGCT